METRLILKWGTVKGWEGFNEGTKARELMDRYVDSGMAYGAMQQRDTPEQKQIICDIIDAVDDVWNDWDGKSMSKDDAKKYVMDYRK